MAVVSHRVFEHVFVAGRWQRRRGKRAPRRIESEIGPDFFRGTRLVKAALFVVGHASVLFSLLQQEQLGPCQAILHRPGIVVVVVVVVIVVEVVVVEVEVVVVEVVVVAAIAVVAVTFAVAVAVAAATADLEEPLLLVFRSPPLGQGHIGFEEDPLQLPQTPCQLKAGSVPVFFLYQNLHAPDPGRPRLGGFFRKEPAADLVALLLDLLDLLAVVFHPGLQEARVGRTPIEVGHRVGHRPLCVGFCSRHRVLSLALALSLSLSLSWLLLRLLLRLLLPLLLLHLRLLLAFALPLQR
mmetsp:Transcript_13885/g.32089  ORF Transcript_13885/g.32089 Transcript_13885/m.32089 type:complete len:296 (-) Transcript_13885:325-1212(-)